MLQHRHDVDGLNTALVVLRPDQQCGRLLAKLVKVQRAVQDRQFLLHRIHGAQIARGGAVAPSARSPLWRRQEENPPLESDNPI